MKYQSKNYLYNYNIKLIEENNQLEKKKTTTTTSKHVFCFICSKKLFLLIQLKMFF